MTIGRIGGRYEPLDMDNVIALERPHRPQGPVSGPERSTAEAPPRRHAQSANELADTAQLPANTGTNTVTTADANAGSSLAGALDLSSTGGDGGAAALLAGNDASVSEDSNAAAANADVGDLANRWFWFQTANSSYQNTVSFLDDWRAQWHVGRPWEIDMNGMKEYTAEWDKAHIGAFEPRIEDYFTPEELETLFGDSSLIGGSASAGIYTGGSTHGGAADYGAVGAGAHGSADLGAGGGLDEHTSHVDPFADGLVAENAGNTVTEDNAADRNTGGLIDGTISNDPGEGDRSGEGLIYGSESRWWEAEWDARMRGYDAQFSALNTFRGSVGQGYLDYANEMTLTFLQPPSWDDFVVEMGLEGELALNDASTDNASAEGSGSDEAGTEIDFGGLIDETFGTDTTSTTGTDGDSNVGGTADTTITADGTADTVQQVVIISNPIRDAEGNRLEVDAHGNGFVVMRDGSTIITGPLDSSLSRLRSEPNFAGSFTSALSGMSAEAGLATLGLALPRAVSFAEVLSWDSVRALAGTLPELAKPGFILFLLACPSNGPDGGTVLSAAESERFVQRPGDNYGRLETRNEDGGWSLSQTLAEYMPAGTDRRYVRLENEEYGEFQVRHGNEWVSERQSGERNVRMYLIEGRFEILTDAEFERRRNPLINVPVNPGPGGTPGFVPENSDTSLPPSQPPDLLLPPTTSLPMHEPSWRDLVVSARRFENQLPDNLQSELESAASVGVHPIAASDPMLEQLVNQGTIKFVLLELGQLVVAPHTVDGIEISHAVLSGGQPVIAAGEADIAAAGGVFFGTEITPHSGHYLNGASVADSDRSLELAKRAFEELGITFH